MRYKKILAILLAALLPVTASANTPQTCIGPACDTPAQHLLSSIQQITGVPGMSAAVSKDGQIIWFGSAGLMDIQTQTPVSHQTKFRVASISKLFTAALILQLAENGLIDIDADIRTYVPEWPDHNGAVITLRRLAAHTSGIGHYGAGDLYNPATDYSELTDSLSIYAHKPLAFPPGEAYSYSSYGYALMGAVVESVSGQSFTENLSEVVLHPSGLKGTSIENIFSLPENTSKLYSQSGALVARNSQTHVNGATGILSTPSDLVHFANSYVAGSLVSLETVNMSFRPTKLNDNTHAGNNRFNVGFGWRIGSDWDEKRVVHHSGTTPGARSILSYNRDLKTAVAVLSNAQWVSRIETTGELISTAAVENTNLTPADCPKGRWNYDGVFILDVDSPPKSKNAHGYILVEYTNGVCHGRLYPEAALADWLKQHSAETSFMSITLVATRPQGEKVFAIATPWGAFPFRWSDIPEGVSANGDIAGRMLQLNISKYSTIP